MATQRNSPTIIRVSKREQFVIILSQTIKDNRLSWKARGILCYLLSLPDDWEIQFEELRGHAPDGRDSLRSGLLELEKYGYLAKRQTRNKRGQLARMEWVIYERPLTGNPLTENPLTGNPLTGNPQLLNIKLTKERVKPNTELTKDRTSPEKPEPEMKDDTHQLLVEALEKVTKMDMKIKSNAGRIVRTAKELRQAGYTSADVYRFGNAWLKDWRYRADKKPPTLNVIKTEIGSVKPEENPRGHESFRTLYKQQKEEMERIKN